MTFQPHTDRLPIAVVHLINKWRMRVENDSRFTAIPQSANYFAVQSHRKQILKDLIRVQVIDFKEEKRPAIIGYVRRW